MPDMQHIRTLLRQILALTSDAADALGQIQGTGTRPTSASTDPPLCTPVRLPSSLQVQAAKTAVTQNPANAPRLPSMPPSAVQTVLSDPAHIAVLTTKYWGPALRRLSVSFVGEVSPDLRRRILSHMNAWNCGLSFMESGVGQVRISLTTSGYWSYLGTDALHVDTQYPTMSLQGFSMDTPESEFRRVVRHEAGHVLGCPHEHLRKELVARIDTAKAYPWFARVYGWDKYTVDAQVLTALDEWSLYGTPVDQSSIMCYQIPGAITVDGKPIIGGIDINPIDRQFAQRIYPLGEPQGVQQGQDARAQPFVMEQEQGFVEEPLKIEE